MEELRQNLDFLDDDVSDLKIKLEEQLYATNDRRLQERNKILRVTSLMKTTIQRAEETLVAKNESLFSQFDDNLNKSIETSKQMQNELSSIRSQADDALTSGYGDKLTVENIKLKYDSLQDRLAAVQKAVVAPVFKQVDDDIEVLKNMDIGYFEHIEHLGCGMSDVLTLTFLSQRENDMNPCFPTGLLWVNNMIIVSDKGNKKLKFFTDNGQFLSELLFTHASPYGVCHIKNNSYAVTLPKARQIYIVSIENTVAKVINSFPTYSEYAGLCNGLKMGTLIAAVTSNNIGESHVDIIGFKGEVFLSFKDDPQLGTPLFKFPRYLVANRGVIIISDWRNHSVFFLHEATGNVLREYKGTKEHPLVNPYDLSLDDVGNVYIMNGKDGSVHVLDLHCNLVDVIKETSELLSPRLIAYDNFSGRVVVTYGAGDIKSYHHRVPVAVPDAVPEQPAQTESPPLQSPSFLLPPQQDAHFRCPSPGF